MAGIAVTRTVVGDGNDAWWWWYGALLVLVLPKLVTW